MTAGLSGARAAALDAIPVPVEAGSLLAVGIVRTDGGWRTAWLRDGARRPDPFGPLETDVRAACAASHYLNTRSFGPASW
jgi:hypothetical protein